MLQGRYGDTTGRPYVEGRLSLPRLGVVGQVSFIVDTGADKTVLMPLDGRRLGVDYRRLDDTTVTVGIGGYSTNYVEDAILGFVEPDVCINVYNLPIHISTPTVEIESIPSLLGRDVLDRWSITLDKTNRSLTALVRDADVRIPLSSRPAPRD